MFQDATKLGKDKGKNGKDGETSDEVRLYRPSMFLPIDVTRSDSDRLLSVSILPVVDFFLFISVHVNDTFVKVVERLMCRISFPTDFIQHLSPERDLVSIFDVMCHLKCFSSSSLVCTRMYSKIHAPLSGVITWFCFSDLTCVT